MKILLRLVCCLLLAPSLASAQNLDRWSSRTSGTTATLFDVQWSGARFVVVGANGTIHTSADGHTWTAGSSGTGSLLRHAAWNGSLFAAVGLDGIILTSPDGLTWTARTSGTANYLEEIIATGSQFVAVGGNGTILTSPTGSNWTTRTSNTNQHLVGLARSSAHYVAVGSGGTILTSPDGITWTSRTSGTSVWLVAAAWNGNQFVVVGDQGVILTSTDGVTWTIRTSGTTQHLHDVAWSGSEFVAVGAGGTILASSEGTAWTGRPSGVNATLYGVTWTGSQYVVVGEGGTVLASAPAALASGQPRWNWRNPRPAGNTISDLAWNGSVLVAVDEGGEIKTSPDGTSWTRHVSGTTLALKAVTWTGSRFVAVGDHGTIVTSPDGSSWTRHSPVTTQRLWGIASTGSRVVAVGEAGTIVTSSDGIGWSPGTSGTSTNLFGVGAGGGQFVAVGDGGTVLTSLDGNVWTSRSSGTSSPLRDAVWNGTEFFVVGGGGTIVGSADGVTWSPRTSGTSAYLLAITWNGSGFVAGGTSGTVLASPDGNTWTSRQLSTSKDVGALVWGGEEFVAAAGSTLWTSPDAATWTVRSSGPGHPLLGVTWTGDQFVAVGQHHLVSNRPAVMTSPDGIGWADRSAGIDFSGILRGVAWNGQTLVAFGDVGNLLTSSDGATWISGTTGTFAQLRAMTAANGVFVGVGDEGAVQTSLDGVTWASRTSGVTSGLAAIAGSGVRLVAVGASGTIITSADGGQTWIVRESGTANHLSGVAWDGSQFVVVGALNTILTSPDGVTWTSRGDEGSTSGGLTDVTWTGREFLAIADGGSKVLSSADGVVWLGWETGSAVQLNAAAASSTQVVLVGSNGAILGSSPQASPAPAVVQVASGASFNLFLLSDGSAWAMGDNTNGQFGVFTLSARVLRPVRVGDGVKAIAAGAHHGLLLKNDGSLWVAGSNSVGQLGDGTTTSPRRLWVQVATGVRTMAAGTFHTLMLKHDGSLWAAGNNSSGQLGDGTTTLRSTPVRIATDVTAIAAGGAHSLFIKTDGTLWATGANSAGQLGDGATTDRSTPIQIATGVASASAGLVSTLFVTNTAELWAAGHNASGQLGDGTQTNQPTPVHVASGVLFAANSGGNHNLFVRLDGTLWGMGLDSQQQLAGGDLFSFATPVRLSSARVVAAAAGGNHTIFAAENGSLWVVGNNSHGQIGNGTQALQDVLLQAIPPAPGAAPQIVAQPQSRAASAGNMVSFFVAAHGAPAPAYQWRKGDTPIAGATSARLALSPVQGTDAGAYSVVVSNSHGSVVSDAASLTVTAPLSAPEFSTHPQSQIATAGESVSFTASATSAPTYQWRKGGAAIAGATNATLTLTAVQAADAGTYDVVATNSVASVVSLSATLTVNPAPVAPTFAAHPQSQTVTAGASVSFIASASGTPAPTYQWHKDGSAIPGATQATLALGSVQAADAGTYTVTAANTAGSVASSAATLTVNPATVAPAFTVSPESKTATVGASVTFSASAAGNPAPTYQWFKNGTAIAGATGTSLTLASVTSGDAGTYRVQASNSAGTATTPDVTLTVGRATATVTLGGLGATYDGGPKSVFATTSPPGLPVTITYAGSPAAPITAGSYPVVATVADANYTGTASGTLVIGRAAQTIAFESAPTALVGVPFTITATASSGLPVTFSLAGGNASLSGGSVTLQDAAGATIRATQPGSGNYLPATADLAVTAVKQNQTITFAVLAEMNASAGPFALHASASSGLPVSFTVVSGPAQLNGGVLTLTGEEGLVTVRAAQPGNAAYHPAQNVERSFRVTAAERAPVIRAQPASAGVRVGGTVALSVGAEGRPAPTYQWRKNGAALAGATGSTLTLVNAQAGDAGSYDVVVANPHGSATSTLARITVADADVPPVMVSGPRSQAVVRLQTAAFNASAVGVPEPTYQWFKDGNPLAGATHASLVLSHVQETDAGAYTVVATNPAGTAASAPARLRVIGRSHAGTYFGQIGEIGFFAIHVREDNTGVFLGYLTGTHTPFVAQDVVVDDGGRFQIGATIPAPATAARRGEEGRPPVAAAAQQFTFSGTIGADGRLAGSLAGAATAPLAATRSAAGATTGLSGFYQAAAPGSSAVTYTIVSPAGEAVVLTQTPAGADAGTGSIDSTGRLSVRTANNQTVTANVSADSTMSAELRNAQGQAVNFVGAKDAVLATQRLVNVSTRANVSAGIGVTIAGIVISGEDAKPVLLRAVGPGLAPFGLTGTLARPRLQLVAGQAELASNAGWSTAANAEEIAAAGVRAGGFPLSAGSADAAIFALLPPGSYTAIVSGADGGTGIALIEAYDLSAPATGQKLINISTRAAVGTGPNACFAGFVVSGTVPKRVLVRGVGPSLGAFGVTSLLARPQLTLRFGSTIVAQNSGWAGSADAIAITNSAAAVGAFALTSPDDAALLVSLDPGAYTLEVSGVDGATGVALVEVYEVP